MVRKIVRAMLWGIKGLLALVALGALVLWPWSCGHPGMVMGDRVTVRAEQADWRILHAGCGQGRVAIGMTEHTFPAGKPEFEQARFHNPDWSWELQGPDTWSLFASGTSSWGPFRWSSEVSHHATGTLAFRAFVFPCWLLALITGAWPLASVALLVRRRRRARRLRLTGCCRRCGYDLRATPAAGGARLAVCPECGMASGEMSNV